MHDASASCAPCAWSEGLKAYLALATEFPMEVIVGPIAGTVTDVPADLRLPHCILKINNRINENIISQPI